uniref:TLC domain-containing protein n=1 Tax=Florenciella sp. virus SA2 TaxID=3240092 RepID=A0AB39JE33_9VIRU
MNLIQNNQINYFVYFYNVIFHFNLWWLLYISLNNQSIISLKDLPANKIIEAKTRIINSIQACMLVILSGLHLSNLISYENWFYGIMISPAFGLFDLIVVTLDYKNFKKGYKSILLHHMILMFGPLCITEQNAFIICRLYFFEFTVPILDYNWYLYYTKKGNTLLFKIVSLCSVFSYFVFRIMNNLFIFTYFFTEDGFSGINYYITFIVAILFMGLNLTWFSALVNMFIKKIKII